MHACSNPRDIAGTDSKHNRIFLLKLGIIIISVLVAYSSIGSAGFIWDDDDYVTDNPYLRSPLGLAKLWLEPGATPQYYPLVFSVFWLQYHLWELNPFGYHCVNVLLHIANALLLWRCARLLAIPGSYWAALLFALHPVQVESVAWITELKNILSAFLYFLAFLSYYRFSPPDSHQDEPPHNRRFCYYALSLILFAGALLSKTVTGSLPAAIILIYWWKQGRFPWKELPWLAPFFAMALVMGRITAYLEVHRVLAIGPDWEFTVAERMLIAGRALWFYAGKLIWPHPLIFSYHRWQIDSGAWWQYLYPAAFLLLIGSLWLARKKIGRGPFAALAFFAGTLFPALGFFSVFPMKYSFVADHFQYLASIGIIVLAGVVVERFLQEKRLTRCLLVGGILLACAVLTWRQGLVYQNRLTLFSDVIAKNPASWMAYNNRGAVHKSLRRFDLAMADFQKSINLNPRNAGSFNNRGMIRAVRKEYDQALLDYDWALQLEPNRPDFLVNRARLYLDTGKSDLALADCDSAVRLQPYYLQGRLLRALVLGVREEYDKALLDLNEVVRLDPTNPDGYANRGLVYYRQGRPDHAVAEFSRALLIHPRMETTYFNRALAYLALGRIDQATADLEQARGLGYPLSPEQIRDIIRTQGTGR